MRAFLQRGAPTSFRSFPSPLPAQGSLHHLVLILPLSPPRTGLPSVPPPRPRRVTLRRPHGTAQWPPVRGRRDEVALVPGVSLAAHQALVQIRHHRAFQRPGVCSHIFSFPHLTALVCAVLLGCCIPVVLTPKYLSSVFPHLESKHPTPPLLSGLWALLPLRRRDAADARLVCRSEPCRNARSGCLAHVPSWQGGRQAAAGW